MKFLLEYAAFKNMVTTKDPYLNKLINKDFQNDEPLITTINDDYNNKKFKLTWYDEDYHPIVNRIEDRTSINSVSHFNEVVEYAIMQTFPDTINREISGSGKFALHLNNHNFYLIISLNFDDLFEDETEITMISFFSTTNLKYVTNIIEIYGD